MLRIFLYLICFISAAWIALLFGGPIVLKSLIYSYSSKQLIASDITVTPKLDIKIGRLEYAFKDAEKKYYSEGFSRSINVLWSFLNNKPFIEVQVGPTLAEGELLADSIKLYTPAITEIDFKNILFSLVIENPKFPPLRADIASISLTGKYSREMGLVNELYGIVPTFSLKDYGSWQTSAANLKINELDLSIPIKDQNFKIEIGADKVTNPERRIDFANVKALIGISITDIDLKFTAENVNYYEAGYSIGFVGAEGRYNREDSLHNAKLELSRISAFNGLVNLPQLKIDVLNSEADIHDLDVVGNFQPFSLAVDDQFIGKLPAGKFEVDIRLNNKNLEIVAVPDIKFKDENVPKFGGDGKFNFKLDSVGSLLDCILEVCTISEINSDYKLYFANEWIAGISNCSLSPCHFQSISHRLKTSNTGEIFAAINQSKIFNPIYAFYLFNFFKAGKKVDAGHEVKIN